MKTESLRYPFESIFNLLPAILKQRECTVISMNNKDGVIKAARKKGIFKSSNDINIILDRMGQNVTNITLWASSNQNVYDDVVGDALFEEKLLQTIHKYF